MQIRRHITRGVILPRLGAGKSEPRQLTLSGSHKLGEWPIFNDLCIRRSHRGCPILAFFARVGGDAADATLPVLHKSRLRMRSGYPPSAKNAKDGAPTVSGMPARSRAWATRHSTRGSHTVELLVQGLHARDSRTRSQLLGGPHNIAKESAVLPAAPSISQVLKDGPAPVDVVLQNSTNLCIQNCPCKVFSI